MPEGDTIYKIAGAIAPELEGRALRGVWLRDRGWVAPLAGLEVREVKALGKHMLVGLSRPGAASIPWVLHVHLGMRGRWTRYAPRPDAAPAGSEPMLRLELEDRGWLCRRAARAELLRGVDLALHPALSRLGPDLLARRLDLDAVVRRARAREPRSVSSLLLDQRVACGIGNVFKSEILFLEGLSPQTPVAALDDATLRRLYARGRELLAANLGGWRRTTVRRVDPDHPLRPGENRYWVYGRAELPCLRCGAPIRAGRLGDAARATWWCPRCQRDPGCETNYTSV